MSGVGEAFLNQLIAFITAYIIARINKTKEPTKPPKNAKNQTIRTSYHHFLPQAFMHSVSNVAPNNALSIPITPNNQIGKVKMNIKIFSVEGDYNNN